MANSFLHELMRVFFRYLAVALIFGVWGALYSLLTFAGWDNVVVKAVCLGLGFVTAHFAWRRFRRKGLRRRQETASFVIQVIRFELGREMAVVIPRVEPMGQLEIIKQSEQAEAYVIIPTVTAGVLHPVLSHT